MRNKGLKRFTVAIIVLILIAVGGTALAVVYSPDYVAQMALRHIFKPDNHLKQELVQEVGREKAEEMLQEFRSLIPGGTTAPGDFSAALQAVLARAQSQEKDVAGYTNYDAYGPIVEKYRARLSGIQGEYEGELNSLIGAARNEYRQSGGSLAEARDLFARYRAKGEALEADCDQRFNAILAEMEAELRANNLPTGAVAYARSAYIVMKDNYRDEMLGRAFAALGK